MLRRNALRGAGVRRLGVGLSWNVVSTAVTQGAILIANIFVARMLGHEVFGEFALVYSTLLTFSSMAQIATGITATKYVSEFKISDKARAGRILGLCLVVTFVTGALSAVALVLASPWIAGTVFGSSDLATGVAIASAFVLFSVMNGYQAGALVGLEAFRLLAVGSLVHSLSHLIILFISTWLWGIHGTFAGLVISAAIRWALFAKYLRRESRAQGVRASLAGWRQEKSILYKFSLPAAIAGITTMPAVWFGNVLLVQHTTFGQMGIYGASTNIKNLALYFPTMLYSVATAVLNSHRGRGEDDKYRKLFWVNLWISGGLAVFAAAGLMLFGEFALSLYGAEFVVGYPVLVVLLVGIVFESIGLGVYQIIQAREKMWLSLFVITLPRDAAFVCLALTFVPTMGAVGLAWAYAGSMAVSAVVTIGSAHHIGMKAKASEER